MQELALARRVLVLCGTYTVASSPLINFFKMLKAMTQERKDLNSIRLTASVLLAYRFVKPELVNSGLFSMNNALYLITNKKCKDLRDRIYGIASLFPEKLRQKIPIGYSVTIPECFSSATRAIAEICHSVEFITWKSPKHTQLTKSELDELPSWSIDWSSDDFPVPLSHIFRSRSATRPSFKFANDKILQLRGVRVGIMKDVLVCNSGSDSEGNLRLTSSLEEVIKLFSRL